jgi:hypothetical protein
MAILVLENLNLSKIISKVTGQDELINITG